MAGNTPPITITDEHVDLPRATRRSHRVKTLLNVSLVAMDMFSLFLGFVLGYYAREVLPFLPQPEGQPPLNTYIPTLILHMTIILTLFYASRLYHQRRVFSRFDNLRSIIASLTVGAVMTYGVQELVFRNSIYYVSYPRSLFFYVWMFTVLVIGAGRELHRLLTFRLRARGSASDNLLVVGTGRIARDILSRIQGNPTLGYNIVGVATSKDSHQGRMLGVPILGNYEDLPEIIDVYQVEQIIIALPDAQRNELVQLVTLCQRGNVDLKIYPDIFAYMAGDLNVDDLNGIPLLTVRDIALRGWRLSLKRGLDVIGASFGLVFLSPFMLLTAILIWFEDRGPAFYTQERMGLDGRPFPMIKFRSMRVDAESMGPGWTVEDDPRRTRLGAFLRRTNWDEIPQLINVFLGHMSLVGPRPERPVYVEEFRSQIPRYMERHREKAGITGWAQIHGLRGDTSIAERTAYDLWYVENWSLWLDIKIIFRTVWQSIVGQSPNAY